MRKLLLLLPLLAGGCTVGPDYHPPAQPPPRAIGAFQTSAPGTNTKAPANDWWRLYDDPALDRLVKRALAANTDLRIAQANLLRARSVLREARAGRWPDAELSGSAKYGNDTGGRSQQQGAATQWSYNGSLTASWEVDLFGRIRRSIEAARADAQAQEAARDRVALTVAAETTRAYVNACALAKAVEVQRKSVGIAERRLTIQDALEKAGSASHLDTERAATTLANTRAALPTLEGQHRASLFELAALIGATPVEIPESARNCANAPAPITEIPVGDGRSLLARRPDVREAERKLAADTARIGVATADLYPSISLGGSGNFFRNNEVRGSDSFTFSTGPLISWSFPSLLVGRARLAEAKAGAQASLAQFDGTVVTALKEVEQALSLYAAEGRRNEQLQEAVKHADGAYKLAEQRYRAGAIAFLDLLDAQRQLLDARSALVTSDEQLGSRRVDLFKSLGGGWQPEKEGQVKP